MKKESGHVKKWMYYFTLGVSLILIYKLLDNLGSIRELLSVFLSVVTPFIAGGFIAYVLYIPCKKIEKCLINTKSKRAKKKAKGRAVLLTYIITILLITIISNFVFPVLAESIKDLAQNFQGYFEMTIDKYNELPEDSILKGEEVDEFINTIQNIDLKQYINAEKMAQYAGNALSAVTSIFSIFIAIIVSIYLLLERRNIVDFWKRMIKAMTTKHTYEQLDKYVKDFHGIFSKFIIAQFLDAVVVAILVTIAMSIMGVKYAPLLGFFIGVFNMIPYVGAIIAVVVAGIITLITGGLSQMIWMLVVVLVLQQIDANIINPKIVGGSLKISPLLVIFAVTVGGAYFGIVGMFLAVPVAAVIKIILNDFAIAAERKLQNIEIEKKIK